MPAARCSNCGRFMNARAGCGNPRCNTSNFSCDVVRSSSPPSRSTGRSKCRSPTYSYEVSYSSDVLVEPPRREATTPNCRTCGRFMNATIGCRNPGCIPIPWCTYSDPDEVTLVKMKPGVLTDRSEMAVRSLKEELKITNNKLPPSNILTSNVGNSIPKSSGVTAKPEAVSNIKTEPGVSIDRSVSSVSSLKSERKIDNKSSNHKLLSSNSLAGNDEDFAPQSSSVTKNPECVSNVEPEPEPFFFGEQKIVNKSSNDKLSSSNSSTGNDGNFTPKSFSVTKKPECVSNVKPEPEPFFFGQQKIVNKSSNDKFSSSNSSTGNDEIFVPKSSSVTKKPESVSNVEPEPEISFKPLFGEQKIVNKSSNDKLSSSNTLASNDGDFAPKSFSVTKKPECVSNVKPEPEQFFKPLSSEQKIIDKSFTDKFSSSDTLRDKVEHSNLMLANIHANSDSIINGELKPEMSTDRSILSVSGFIDEQKIINNSFNDKLSSLNGLLDKFENFTSKFSRALAKQKSAGNERYCELIIAKNELQVLVVKIASTHKDLAKENVKLANELTELKKRSKTFVKYFCAKQAALEVKFDELLSIFDKKLSIEVSATESSHTLAYGKYSLLETMCIQQQDTLIQMLSDQKKLTEENTWLLDEQTKMRRKLAEMEEALVRQRSEIREQKRGEASLPDASPHYNVYKIVAIAFVTNCVCFPLFRFISRRISKQILQ